MEPIFKKSWLEAIAYLPESVRNRIVLIVMFFQLNGTLPENMSSTVRCAVRFILAELGTDLSTLADTSLFPPKKVATPQKEEPKQPEPAPIKSAKNLFTDTTHQERMTLLLGVNAYHKYILQDDKQISRWPENADKNDDLIICLDGMKQMTYFPNTIVLNRIRPALDIIKKYDF